MAYETEMATLTTSVENFNTAVTGKKTSILDPKVTSGLGSQSTAKTHEETAKGYLNETEQFKETTYDSLRSIDSIATQNLAAIAQSKSGTAVDVFVYDTSKDSDGGAWRKRTSKTSWYNETLGTATRGSRKDFPAVAVIVAESDKVTIYDADDPTMPMWMVFNRSTVGVYPYWWKVSSDNVATSVSALNGVLCIGVTNTTDPQSGLLTVEFIKDALGKYHDRANQSGYLPISIGEYDYTNVPALITNLLQPIVNEQVNGVAMTVLPNAPINPDTDLPVPTIAVATDSGVSVIKDDGSVVDISASTWTLYAKSIKFLDDNKLYFNANSSDSGSRIYYVEPIPDADLAYLGNDFENASNAYERYIPDVGGAWTGDMILSHGSPYSSEVEAIGNDLAEVNGAVLGRIARKEGDPSNGMHSVTTTGYNTGWMLGDTQLATLMDTDDTDISNTNLVTDFFNSTGSWAGLAAGTSISGGVFNTDGTTSGELARLTDVGIEEGKLYRVSFRISTISAGSLGVKIGGGDSYVQNSIGKYQALLKGTSTDNIQLKGTSSAVGTIDNLHVDLVGPVINGDLETNTNWTERLVGTGSSSAHATGQYSITGPNYDNRGERYQDVPTIIGKSYITTVQISQDNGAVVGHQNPGLPGATLAGSILTANVGTNYYKWVAKATTTRVVLRSQGGTSIFTDVKVEEAVADRSRHNSLMALRGSFQVTPAATNTELVGYKGTDDNDSLEDVTGSITHPGTDYTWAWWGKSTDIVFGTAGTQGYIPVVDYNPQAEGYYVTLGGSTGSRTLVIRHVNSSLATINLTLSETIDARYPIVTDWTQYVIVKKGTVFSSYINGKLDIVRDSSYTASFAAALEGLNHGDNFRLVRTHNGGNSMFRMSTSAATAGQVEKMYRDEEPLFRENAACTLYGTSNEIRALAYDEDTKLLHVGSVNDGGDGGARSVFRGLQRVSNTTEAAGVALSASNDLVVEE